MNQINKNLQRRLAEFKEKSGMSQKQLAAGIGIAPAAVSGYLSGTYSERGGKYDSIEPKIEAFLEIQAERAARKELEIAFVKTKTVCRMMEVMRDAHHGGEVAVIYGQAGLGKTRAVRRYCEDIPSAVLVEANPSFSAMVLMRKIAKACKLPEAGSLNDLYEAVCDRLDGSGRVIVVDEAENLPLRALEMLRRLHDETGCALVLAGMPRLVANLKGKSGELVQLYSRVSFAFNIGNALPEEELEMIARASMPDADDETVMKLVEEADGNTRRLTKLMKGIARTAVKAGRQPDKTLVGQYAKLIIR